MDKLLVLIKKIYLKIPTELLNLVAPIYYLLPRRIRYGKNFWKTTEMIHKYENITSDEYASLVNENIKAMVEYCYKYVPYYKRVMDERNLKPENITCVEDLTKLPILTKEILFQEGDNMISTQFNKEKLVKKQTSGSTGISKTIYFEKSTEMQEWAYVMYLWGRAGYEMESSRLVLRAKKFRAQDKGKIYQWDAARRELSIDVKNMDDKNCAIYCKVIERYKPDFIYGYPSSIFQLCEYIENNTINHQFRAILCVSENLSQPVREYIESVLKCSAYTFYGHTERAVIAGERDRGNSYYIEPTYGYAEIVNQEGEWVSGCEKGEILTTGFTNYAMPLLRYATGDVASWAIEDSKIHRYIESVDGRTMDYIISAKTVAGVDEAIAHINKYNTGHSEAIMQSYLLYVRHYFLAIEKTAEIHHNILEHNGWDSP